MSEEIYDLSGLVSRTLASLQVFMERKDIKKLDKSDPHAFISTLYKSNSASAWNLYSLLYIIGPDIEYLKKNVHHSLIPDLELYQSLYINFKDYISDFFPLDDKDK